MQVLSLGDTAVLLTLSVGDPSSADLADALSRDAPPGVVDAVAAFKGISIVYDPAVLTVDDPVAWLGDHARRVAATVRARATVRPTVVELPVVYGGDRGPDLNELAATLGLSPDELIERHAAATYTVAAVGFLPGFAYLEGLPAALHAPRRSTPRVRVPAGSVAIGGPYTGVYPVESPGGWHLIGHTPRRLFDPADPAAMPLRVGDRVRFVPRPGGRK